VGYGQMHWKLQSDARVIRLDRENFRHFDVSKITDPVDLVVMDVSFISITLLLPKIIELFRSKPSGRKTQQLIALIKPQFEAGKEHIGKGGIVQEAAVHKRVVEKIKEAFKKRGFNKIHVTESPIQGMDGNKEFLIVGNWNTA
jgi:23S rRNA (cytidine1920-2'-O)/16S rRNA (cytidine1409-2'-O)-methyltransferase